MRHTRRGSGRTKAIGLGLAMLAGLGVAGYAISTTIGGAGGSDAHDPGAVPIVGGGVGAGEGVAGAERLGELLTAVQAYATDGEYGAAEAILREAVGTYQGDQDLRVAYGEFLLGRERTEEAYDQYVAALSIGPRDHQLEYRAGLMAVQLGRHQRAVEHFGAARQARPDVAEYALMLANEQLELGELPRAKATLLQAIALDEGLALAWGALARVALQENDGEGALRYAREAVELDPRQPAYRLYEARALKRLGQRDESLVEEAVLVLTGLPDEVLRREEFLRTLGECYGLLGRPGEAASRYEAAFNATRHTPFAFEAALWHERAGNEDEARTWAQTAASLGSARAEAWLSPEPGGG
ncbi:MAG: tetratricopeptide repeat protein [Phycisphaerales bacterium JB040]